jgi:hypothetical protein
MMKAAEQTIVGLWPLVWHCEGMETNLLGSEQRVLADVHHPGNIADPPACMCTVQDSK